MIDIIMTAVGNLLYPLFSVIFIFIDLLQIIFNAFAGIGDVYVGGVTALGIGATHVKGSEGGLLYYFLQTDLVKNLLISIMVLALVLLVIFTILAFLKNIYAAKPKKWQDIIGDAIKGLGMFIVIPVLCLLGVWVGNILLRAINSATNTTSSDRISAMLFKSTAYNANRIRLDDDFTMEDLEYYRNTFVNITALEDEVYDEYNNLNKEYYANAIDDWYIANWGILINPLSIALISPGYNLANMNYLIMVGGGVFILYSLCAISFGMIKRLFTLLVLYVISPVMCALYPIKGDSPVKSWTGDFVKNTISAYGYVAGLNIMFALLPLFQRIQIPGAYDILGIIPLLITIAGLYMVKDVIALISGYIGAGNAFADGASLMNTVKGRVGWAAKKAQGITGAFVKARGASAAGGSFFGSLTRSAGQATMDTLSKTVGLPTVDEFRKTYEEQYKAGTEHPNPGAERAVTRYQNRRSADQFDANIAAAQAAITTARAGGRDLTNEEMATLLTPIADKEAKRRIAQVLADYRNEYAIANGRGTTTAEKVLESEEKVVTEENNRQEAYGAQTRYTSSVNDLNVANANVSAFRTNADNASVNGVSVTFNADGTTNLTKVADEDIKTLEANVAAARGPRAKAAAQAALNNAVKTNRIIKEYAELVDKQEDKQKEIKSSALSLASQISQLAGNYNGNNKTLLTDAANAIKAAANNPAATPASIDSAITTARATLTTEMNNILNTGHR